MMTRAQYGKALKKVENALQGIFPETFADYLRTVVEKEPLEDWEGATTKVSMGPKRLQDLIVADFLEALREVRHERAIKEARVTLRPPGKGSPDWKGMAERVCADPAATETSKQIARGLAARKMERPPAVQGGEKYRRKS